VEYVEPKKYKDTLIFPAALDPDALKIIRRLNGFGHTAYLVGGCVRDLLLGSIPKDFDVSTSASPRQVKRLFKNSQIIGRRFKLAHVRFRNKIIEVSTFRKSPGSENDLFKSDGLLILRDNVYGSERDDALRRDFTVNSLFYDIFTDEVIDYTGGVEDIRNKVLRTIGEPDIRFQEDPVRILRAVRFSSRLGLEISASSFESMKRYTPNLRQSAAQRVTEEIIRLMACGSSNKALVLMMSLGIFELLLPDVHQCLATPMDFFDWNGDGRSLLLELAKVTDSTDKGRRNFSNPMFMSVLFAPFAGTVLRNFEGREGKHPDPTAVLDSSIRPVMLRMGVSRRDLIRVKLILSTFRKLNSSIDKKRIKPRHIVCRDYFPGALEFYRQVKTANDESLQSYEWWSKQQKGVKNRNRSVQGPRKRRQRSESRRRKRAAGRPESSPNRKQKR